MDTSGSFSSYKSQLGSHVEFSDNEKRIIVAGYLGSELFITNRLVDTQFDNSYNHASTTAGSIESILQDSFEPLKVSGIQTPGKKDNTQSTFYSAFLHSSDDLGLVFSLLLDYGIQRRHMHPRFSASFPLGHYESNTKDALGKIWQLVQNIEHRSRTRHSEDFRNGYILLMEKGKIIASGQPALEKIGLELIEKELRHKDPTGYKLGSY